MDTALLRTDTYEGEKGDGYYILKIKGRTINFRIVVLGWCRDTVYEISSDAASNDDIKFVRNNHEMLFHDLIGDTYTLDEHINKIFGTRNMKCEYYKKISKYLLSVFIILMFLCFFITVTMIELM